MNKFLLIIFVLSLPTVVNSQANIREVGFRTGASAGLTYRQYLSENQSFEVLLSFRNEGLQLTLLRQMHENVLYSFADNFYLLYGYGGHAGYNFTDRFRSAFWNDIYYRNRKLSPLIGADGYAAIEYRIKSIPLTIALDFKPYFEVSLYQYFRLQLWDLGFALKYRF